LSIKAISLSLSNSDLIQKLEEGKISLKWLWGITKSEEKSVETVCRSYNSSIEELIQSFDCLKFIKDHSE